MTNKTKFFYNLMFSIIYSVSKQTNVLKDIMLYMIYMHIFLIDNKMDKGKSD